MRAAEMKDKNILVGIAYNDYDPVSGRNGERVSEDSVEATAREVLAAVTEMGYSACIIPLQKSFMRFLHRVKEVKPDVLINLCEGFLGQSHLEANVAAALELFGFAFTGNDSRTLALCLNKFKTKAVLRSCGLSTAPSRLVTSPDQKVDLPYPLMVKPNAEDASLGIHSESVVHDKEALDRQIRKIFELYAEPALVEQFIDGREFNVAIYENGQPQALPVSEIDFTNMPEGHPKICSYEAKWFEDHILCQKTPPVCPAKIDEDLRKRIQDTALVAFQTVGCRDYARIDFRMDQKGKLMILEVNPNPDISLDAGFARAIAASGMEYGCFWERMIDNAVKRKGKE